MNPSPLQFDTSDPLAGISPFARVEATEAALDLLGDVRARHGAVSFHHPDSFADGTALTCLAKDELELGDHDHLLGEVEGAPVYVSTDYALTWRRRQLIIDAIRGHAGGFSLEGGLGRRFFTRTRLYKPEHLEVLGLI